MEKAQSQQEEARKPRSLRGTGWRWVKAFGRHALMPALEKLIPQGSAELAQALYTGNGFVPYGPTQIPVERPPEAESAVASTDPPELSNFDKHAALYGATYCNRRDQGRDR